MIFEWNNLHVKWPNSNRNGYYYYAFKDISGRIESGQLLVIMGYFGSGNSALMNTLAGTLPKNSLIKGEILIDKRNIQYCERHKLFTYLPKKPKYWKDLTARETIEYTAKLKMKNKTCFNKKFDELIKNLDLDDILDKKMDNLSRGEQNKGDLKRVFIACSLISDSPIIFIEEPIQKLNTLISQKIIKELKRQALQYNKIIIISTLKPGHCFLKITDKLIIFNSGHMIYNGYTNKLVDIQKSKPRHIPLSQYIFWLSITPHPCIDCHTRLIEEPTFKWIKEKSNIMNYKPKLSEIFILLKRRILLKKKRPINFLKYTLPGVLLFYFILVISFNSIYNYLNILYNMPFEKNDSFLFSNFPMLFDILKAPLLAISLYLKLGVSNAFMNEIPIIKEECAFFYYSPTSYYLSVLVYELIYNYFWIFTGYFIIQRFYIHIRSMVYIYFILVSPIISIPISLFTGIYFTRPFIIITLNVISSLLICLYDCYNLQTDIDITNSYKLLLWMPSIIVPEQYFIRIMSYYLIDDITFKNERIIENIAKSSKLFKIQPIYDSLLIKCGGNALSVYTHWIIVIIIPIFFILMSIYVLRKKMKISLLFYNK
ncbi:ATP-binding cassette sub-family G member 5 [Astathelohania contejeani]|uniref:ATP-binding cassette sub-family G member 5 n=1 Tax=Astathelohania contejeani TaxID=164912 RepID=A0ABQ7I191_9MICR|nr:ATP-binding cassette sub-family G member 5 [Thelohania contejeani]